MAKLNKKAFNILTNDEQSSLALQKVHGKSTWEAGSILKRSHYKYLEIKQRAERFFELFTLHYDTYRVLIPNDVAGFSINETFAEYLRLVIEKRMTVKAAALKTGEPLMADKKTREAFLSKEILKLKKSETLIGQNLYTIIMEFDRYNNFRILPSDVQEPSAFKRRNKTRYKKHLTLSTTIHAYSLMRVKELYEYTKGPKPKVMGYIALTNYEANKSFEKIVAINATDKNLKHLSSISLYVFPKEQLALDYIKLVKEYVNDPEKDPRKGLLFWPKFRTIIKYSLNYNEVNNIAPTRIKLMSAIKDMDDYYVNRTKKKIAQSDNSYK